MTNADVDMGQGVEPQIVEFGPYRVIGLRYAGKNELAEIKALWNGPAGLPARAGEIQAPEGISLTFGVCRCLPGMIDGSFEYIAAVAATSGAPIPEGMVEAQIPAGTYAAFPVAGLTELSSAWHATGVWFAAHPEWQSYCTSPETCECATHPTFELYPPEFAIDGKLFIYIPIHPIA